MLSRLLVRQKLQLLAVVPLLAIAFTTVPLVADQVQGARRSSAVASKVQAAARLGAVVQDLERERLLSLAYLALPGGGTGPLVTQSQAVRDEIADARAAMGLRPNPALIGSLAGLDALEALRGRVLTRSVAGDVANAEFDAAIRNLVDGLELAGGDESAGGGLEPTLLALLLANERSSSAAATLLAAVAAPNSAGAAATSVDSALAVEGVHVDQFEQRATPGQLELFGQVQRSVAAKQVTDLQNSFRADPPGFLAASPVEALVGQVYGAVDAQSGLRWLVQDKIVQDLAAGAASSATGAVAAATVFGALSVGLVIALLALSVVVGRSVARPLRRLTVAADRVADLASAELVRVADEDRDEQAAPRLAAVDVRSSDEIGDLAAAINRVQAVAALLLERQVVIRRNIAVMFGNIGRHTQNLVGRQLALIDSLERNEQDAELLSRLYRLDHLTSRLRRNANSLLVLSGAVEQNLSTAPSPVAELVRAALGEIEEFQRVDIGEFHDVLVRPDAASDIALLLAELLENATSFSPPTTRVQIGATVAADGCRVVVVDRGIGMSAQQLAEENERLVRRERLDIAPTDVLGLFVVGRLARRHGATVALRPTPGGGLTAEVLLPARLLLMHSAAWPVFAGTPQQDAPTAAAAAAHERPARPSPSPSLPIAEPPAAEPPAAEPVPAEPAVAEPAVAEPAVAEPVPAEPAVAKAGVADPAANLQRRVRGAQLPDTDRANRPRWAAGESPEAAKALVEQFESGEQRAGRHAAIADQPETAGPVPEPLDPPTVPLPVLGPATPSRPTGALYPPTSEVTMHRTPEFVDEVNRAAQRALDHLVSVSSRIGAGAGSVPYWFGPAQRDTEQQPPPPPGAAGLQRRVRGANLPPATSAGQNARVQLGQPDDPDSARGFVLDVEAAIARAVGDISTAGGPPKPTKADS